MAEKNLKKGPIFIAGPERSGTSLIYALLTSHPRIAMSRRTNLWTHYYNQYGDLSQPENFERCLEMMMRYKRLIKLNPDPERLRRIDAAEDILRSMGFKQVRVRDHGEIARLEIADDDFGLALEPRSRARIVRELQGLGYSFVALDLEGYRTGSMNVGLSPDETQTEAG